MIVAHQAELDYQDGDRIVRAVHDLNLIIDPGEFIGILGPSGSGKSSLLYLLSGLKIPTSGQIAFEGTDYSRMGDSERSFLRRARFGFVFQQPYLLGYLNVLENVLAPTIDAKRSREKAMGLLVDLGLGDKMHRFPAALSGGERQRACVARALINDPAVIFADEPTASLDRENGMHVVELLNAHRGEGAVVLVTHDPQTLEYANRVYTLQDGSVLENGQAFDPKRP